MKLIKKSGKIVDFNPDKIKTSIENTADDIGIFINSHEIEMVIKDIEEVLLNFLRDETPTSSYEVRSLVIDSLSKFGYKNMAKSYALNNI